MPGTTVRGVSYGVIDAARMAEDSGYFDSVWVGDNFIAKPRVEAMVTLAAIAAHTSKVKLGTICMSTFAMRHPVQLAIQWASLDVLAKGRTILGACIGGAGYPKADKEWEVMGVSSNERVGRMVEGINLLRRFWTEEQVTHHGRYYNFDDVEVLPKPIQKPVPIWIALNPRAHVDEAVVDRGLRRVAKYGEGWQTDGTPVDTFRSRFDRIREYAAEEGRDPSILKSALHLMVNINDDKEAAWKDSTTFLEKYYGAGAFSLDVMDTWIAGGPPEKVAGKIQSYIDAGCTTPVLRFAAADLKGQLKRCIEEVLPLLHGVEKQARAATHAS